MHSYDILVVTRIAYRMDMSGCLSCQLLGEGFWAEQQSDVDDGAKVCIDNTGRRERGREGERERRERIEEINNDA